jgi:hypothetical protein
MNTRKACLAGLAAVAAVLAGCAAQYRNPSACEQEMRHRLADGSQGELSVAHRAVSHRGSRVVVEGTLEKTPGAAAGEHAASAPVAASAAVNAASAPVAASAAAKTASAPAATPKPTTPVAAIVQKLGIKKPERTPTAAECMFDESGLKSFRWLAPAVLAKTTPEPGTSTH